MLEGLRGLLADRALVQQLSRFNDLFERYLTYQRAELILHGVILDQPPESPTPQDLADLYPTNDALLQFDQERQGLAAQWGREPTDEEVLAHIAERDTR